MLNSRYPSYLKPNTLQYTMFQCHFLVIYTTANLDSAADLLTWLHQGFIKRWITHEIEKTITINKAGNFLFILIRIVKPKA